MKETYTIYKYTFWPILYTFACWIIPLIVLFKLDNYYHFDFYVFIIVIIIFSGIGFFLGQIFGLRRIDVKFKKDGIIFKIYGINSNKIKKTLKTEYSRIAEFNDFELFGDQRFRLIFKSGNRYTIYKSKYWRKNDDFDILIKDFKKIIENQDLLNNGNEMNSNGKIDIYYSNFFDRPIGKFFYLISIVFLIVSIMLFFIGKKEMNPATPILIVVLIGYIITYNVKKSKT